MKPKQVLFLQNKHVVFYVYDLHTHWIYPTLLFSSSSISSVLAKCVTASATVPDVCYSFLSILCPFSYPSIKYNLTQPSPTVFSHPTGYYLVSLTPRDVFPTVLTFTHIFCCISLLLLSSILSLQPYYRVRNWGIVWVRNSLSFIFPKVLGIGLMVRDLS